MSVDPAQVQQAERALAAVRDEWLERRGVLAVEVARLWVDARPSDEVGIRVTVEQKLPAEDIPPGELFPRRHGPVRVQLVEGSPLQPE